MLVVAHPGHELRVHHWLELARPTVWVLTDGSGHGDRGRVASSAAVVARAGGRPAPFFGHFADHQAYGFLLAGEAEPWIAIVDSLARALVEEGVGYVVADAVEGFNPIHDLCRVVADGAVAIAERRGSTIARYGFPLEARPDAALHGLLAEAVVVELDDEAVERKLAAGRGYPEMAAEVERALAAYGTEAFRREHLRSVDPEAAPAGFFTAPPYYEEHGARQVKLGFYDRVLRFREHFLPIAEAVARHAAAPPSEPSDSPCGS
jgi:hypothetical protein